MSFANERRVKVMNKKVCFICLFVLLFLSTGASKAAAPTDLLNVFWWECIKGVDLHRFTQAYPYGETPDDLENWKEGPKGVFTIKFYPGRIEAYNKDVIEGRKKVVSERIAVGYPKTYALRWGKFPFVQEDKSAFDPARLVNKTAVWLRDPEGHILPFRLFRGKEDLAVTVPTNLDLAGLHVLGGHIDVGEMDIDLDGVVEKLHVHLYPKYLFSHRKVDGDYSGHRPESFFKAPDKMALEIGSLIRGMCPCIAVLQGALKEYKMKVLYGGKPLADAEVILLTESGLRKSVRTDSRGRFSIITPAGKKAGERDRYLYIVGHHDPLKKEYHCASLLIQAFGVSSSGLYRSSPAAAFMLWSIVGGISVVIFAVGGIYHKKRRDRETVSKFENYRVKKSE